MVQPVGSKFFNSMLLERMQDTNQKINLTQMQASTGKLAQKYSEYGTNAKPVIELTHQKASMNQYIANNSYMIGCQDKMELTIKGLINIATDLRTNLVSLRSSTMPDPSTFTSSIENALRSVESAINRTDNSGAYLFAGSANIAPVDLSSMPAVSATSGTVSQYYYRGNDDKQTVQIGDNLSTSYSINANESGIEKLIRSMSMALNSSIVGNDSELLSGAINLSEESVTELTEILARIGKNQRYMIDITEKMKNDMVILEESLSIMEDVDLPSALTQLTQQQTQLTALFMAMTSSQKISLMDFMR